MAEQTQTKETSSRGNTPQDSPNAGQTRWLRSALGQVIKVRLLDGKSIKGELQCFDQFTLQLRINGGEQPSLVYKQAVAYLSRDLEGEK